MHHLLCEIWDLVQNLNVKVLHAPGSQNSMANKVAKWGVVQQGIFVGNNMPDMLES